MNKIRLFRLLTVDGYVSLALLLFLWYAWLAPSTHFAKGFTLTLALVPPALPMRGLLKGDPYTHAWSAFIALIYFAHGVVEAYASEVPLQRVLALLEVLFSAQLFLGAMLYARVQGREQRGLE